MNRYGKIFGILSGSENIRKVCFAILFDDLPSIQKLTDFLGHPNVERFQELVFELTGSDPNEIGKLAKDCRDLWPNEIQANSEIVPGPGLEAFSENKEEPLLALAYGCLQSGIPTEVLALQIACLVKEEEQMSPEVRTSDVTTLLRATGYKVPNPAALIRSLADRADPVIEVLDEKVGPRQELQFRLLPAASEELRRQILTVGSRILNARSIDAA